jgi:phosphatidylserine/phosphatidylglycerophosphate/cardiolipin synthase-like enzyme
MPPPGFDDIVKRFFVQDNDPILADDDEQTSKALRVPATTEGNIVDYLIDGHEYFGMLRQEIATLLAGAGERFLYLTNWHFGLASVDPRNSTHIDGSVSAWNASISLDAFKLEDGQPGATFMKDDLVQLAAQGVDVRTLVWVNPLHFSSEKAAAASGYMSFNLHSIVSTQWLRDQPAFRSNDAYKKLLLNTLCHPIGSMHMKMAICGDENGFRAYVSGLDLVSNRVASRGHNTGLWHDVGVRVQGAGALSCYNFFRQLYNEQVGRKVQVFRIDQKEIVSHYGKEVDLVRQRTLPPAVAGTQHIQLLRTLPQMNFFPSRQGTIQVPYLSDIPVLSQAIIGLLTCIFKLIAGYGQDEFSFAPGGVFEFRTAMRKAIAHAEHYIYIEDQAMYNMELMDWLHAQMVAKPNLKLIMVHGGDPADPPNTFMPHAINAHLVRDRPDLGSRVAFYEAAQTMHAKLTIIDDTWAAVGSANAFKRSFYTDGECSVAVLDESAVTFAQRLRAALWGEHCDLLNDALSYAAFLDLDASIALWDPLWGPNIPFSLAKRFTRLQVPFVVCDKAPGLISVTSQDKRVVGQGTAWSNALIGKSLKVVGEHHVYRIEAVNSSTELHLALKKDPSKGYQGNTGSNKAYLVEQPGRWLLDELPAFDGVKYAQSDADSRLDY